MLLDRFIRYVKIDTAADPNSSSVPSSLKQLEFLELLKEELASLGCVDLMVANNAVLFASIPASDGCEEMSPIGLIAHVDTSADAPSLNVKPIVHTNYDGKDILLKDSKILVNDYPELRDFVGHTIITSSGDTLLGADDKAGVAILVSLPQFLLQNNVKHPLVRLAFTTDEEIGSSIDNFDVEKFGVKVAYTLDSGGVDLLEYENFNAAGVTVTVLGKNIHPGYAFGKMVNACDIATEFNNLIPNDLKPAQTQRREGFFHLNQISGDVSKTTLHYIVRDFEYHKLLDKITFLEDCAKKISQKYSAKILTEVQHQYRNMREVIPEEVIEKARNAYKAVGIEPLEKPIRGGTDGARLSFLGVPTPNLFNGGMNFHSKHEYCSLDAMEKALEMVAKLVSVSATKN